VEPAHGVFRISCKNKSSYKILSLESTQKIWALYWISIYIYSYKILSLESTQKIWALYW
jgi:hypothetical protein